MKDVSGWILRCERFRKDCGFGEREFLSVFNLVLEDTAHDGMNAISPVI